MLKQNYESFPDVPVSEKRWMIQRLIKQKSDEKAAHENALKGRK